MVLRLIIGLTFLAASVGYESPSLGAPPNDRSSDAGVKPRGNRLLGVSVTEGAVGFDAAFAQAKSAGLQFIELAQQWDEIERKPGEFDSPYLKIANQAYPALNTSIVLSINPIDTTNLRVPKWLTGRSFDDPQFIRAFNRFVDFILDGLSDANIVVVSIGNEVDVWLGDDAKKWKQYARFAASVRKHIKSRRPKAAVGVKMTWPAIVSKNKNRAKAVNRSADAIMATYYPLNDDFTVRAPTVVGHELGQLVSQADGKPVFLLETGYPSGADNQSSPQQQADFIDAIFSAWDQHADVVKMVNFVWLHDMSNEEVKTMTQYYAVDTPAFSSFLATLGLKTRQGEAKPAFERVKHSAKVRGWK